MCVFRGVRNCVRTDRHLVWTTHRYICLPQLSWVLRVCVVRICERLLRECVWRAWKQFFTALFLMLRSTQHRRMYMKGARLWPSVFGCTHVCLESHVHESVCFATTARTRMRYLDGPSRLFGYQCSAEPQSGTGRLRSLTLEEYHPCFSRRFTFNLSFLSPFTGLLIPQISGARRWEESGIPC